MSAAPGRVGVPHPSSLVHRPTLFSWAEQLLLSVTLSLGVNCLLVNCHPRLHLSPALARLNVSGQPRRTP
mgnify:CR=1 FL=1